MRVKIRGYRNQVLRFAETVEIPDDDDVTGLMQTTAARHAEQIGLGELHMIEIEFLDEPDVNQRFFRFGTDPSSMVLPIGIDLSTS
jgi:hypothetical protein